MRKARSGRPGAKDSQQARVPHKLEIELRTSHGLTHAEARIVYLLAEGLSYGEIAGRLEVSYHTVHSHMKAIHQKLGVATNLKLLARIRELGEK